MGASSKRLQVFTGNANPELAQEIADYLGVKIGDSEVTRFSDGEIQVRTMDTVRGSEVFIIQPTCHPVNENIMELLIMIDAMKRASAKHVAAVIPYYGYASKIVRPSRVIP